MPSTYYFSNTGNDLNDGLSSDTCWQNIEKLNSIDLQPGDKILFKCGDQFRGRLIIKNSGTPENLIRIGSFGVGEKPVLSGSEQFFTEGSEGNSISKCRIERPVKGVFVGNEWLNIARYPSKGFFGIDGGNKTCLKDRELLLKNIDCTGAVARIRAVNWQYEIARVARHEGNTLYFEQDMIYQCDKDYGYFLDNKLDFLTDPEEWYYDEDGKLLHFMFPGDPMLNKVSVEAVIHDHGILLQGAKHVIIENIQFQHFHLSGIYASQSASDIKIKNCDFRKIHQDGIFLDSGSHKIVIDHNSFADIKGRGIALLDCEGCSIINNQVKRIGLYPGYGYDGVNSGTGIAILKTEVIYSIGNKTLEKLVQKIPAGLIRKLLPLVDKPFADEKFLITALQNSVSKDELSPWIDLIIQQVSDELAGFTNDSANNYIGYNCIEETGLHSIRLDGKNHLCEFNICKESLLYMNDGASIYSWAQNYNYSVGSTIRKNIVINARGNVVATPDFHRFAHGIYIDNKCVGFTIEENIVTGATWGILINDEAREHTICKNILFDNEVGLAFSEYFMPGTLYGCQAFDNILFARRRDQRAMFIESRIGQDFNPVTTDRNFYGSSYYTYPIMRLTFRNGHRVWEEYDLKAWQQETGMDQNSQYFAPPDPEARPRNSHIIINDSKDQCKFKIDNSIKDHFDIDGNPLGDEVTLEPFMAIIVLND
jgi:parallel beta-helix repeat protein